MRDNDSQELLRCIEIASEAFDLDESLIEKDYFVTQGIHLLSRVENDYFQLVFCGGTALAKAHKTIQRMSEDCDFKIQAKAPALSLSKSQLLKQLKQFREEILTILENRDLTIGHTRVRNEGRYLTVHLDYPSAFPVNTGLRPHMLLEFTYSNARLPIERKKVGTLIEDALPNVTLMDRQAVSVISVEETAAEKWVALTRKVAAIERGHYPDDATLVRHIYDLSAIQQLGHIQEAFFTLVPAIAQQDAQQFKGQHPEYAADPQSEIRYSLKILKNHTHWQERYEAFKESMIYGHSKAPSYQEVLDRIEALSVLVMVRIESVTRDEAKDLTTPISPTLQAMLHQYVAMEVQQAKWLQHDIQPGSLDYEAQRQANKEQAIALGKQITALAVDISEHPELQTRMSQEIKAPTINERGGDEAILQRFAQGSYLPEDIQAVIGSIRREVATYKRKQQELNRDHCRGGRSL